MTEAGALRDVIIIGAGPAGATAATLLARAGHDVLVLEKEHFPRFHVGESLLPAGMPILERLGVVPAEHAFLYKRGAQFVDEESGRAQTFHFADALPGCPDHAWHVDRALFDTLLRDRALEAGAEVRHGQVVEDVAIGRDAVHVTTRSPGGTGTASDRPRARYLIDASGQDRFLGKQGGHIQPYRRFGAVAVYSRFEGLAEDVVQEIGPGNDIRILLRPDGWGWMIPLAGGHLSVGMVSRDRLDPTSLDDGLLNGPLGRRWTAGATRAQTGVVRNFSYKNTRACGARFASVGDAACFLDPIFSSGVALAMRGAEDLADLLGPALTTGTEAAPDLLAPQQRRMDRAYHTFAALIDRFYNTHFAESLFLSDPTGSPLRHGVMSVLAGDVWRDDNPFQDLLLRARRRSREAL